MSKMASHSSPLGDHELSLSHFPDLDAVFDRFYTEKFLKYNYLDKLCTISQELANLIEQEQMPCFLLSAVTAYVDRIVLEQILPSFSLQSFEMWLNQHSGLDEEKNLLIRAKIAGKYLPRSAYQQIFPIGGNKMFEGPHIVTAHSSPDLDTTIATFWGWLDAFACRVSTGMHIWNVPGGPPEQVEINLLFDRYFGPHFFHYASKSRNALTITAFDLMSQVGFAKKKLHELSFEVSHERTKNAVSLVDQTGHYLGDWRQIDIEIVRQVINGFNSCLRWAERELHMKLIHLFSQENITRQQIEQTTQEILEQRLDRVEPVKEFTLHQRNLTELYLQNILKVPTALKTTFEAFIDAIEKEKIVDFTDLKKGFEGLFSEQFFDDKQHFIASRPLIFAQLEKIFLSLTESFTRLRKYTDTLEVALKIKMQVFGYTLNYLNSRSDIEEIRVKMASYPYLTVTVSEEDGKLVPLGVIYATEINKRQLGTVTVRDFSNTEETIVPPYLEIVSAIDHHKMSLQTYSPARVLIGDVQSSNVLIAQQSFLMHDEFSTIGMDLDKIEQALKKQNLSDAKSLRVFKQLAKRKLASLKQGKYFVHPAREFLEYLHYLYAIFDDTDLLTKVTTIDVLLVAELLNRLKSLQMKEEMEVISFDELEMDHYFTERAAQKLLKNEELYSIYSKVYLAREKAVEGQFELCAHSEKSTIFADTKIQNGCVRVGQTKMFCQNVVAFKQYREVLMEKWVERAQEFVNDQPAIDLHLHMISTIASAKELHDGVPENYWHKDELWIWIPQTDAALEHLRRFLNAFQMEPKLHEGELEIELIGRKANFYEEIFKDNFLKVERKILPHERLDLAVIRYKAGSINSRKSKITPYLPKVV